MRHLLRTGMALAAIGATLQLGAGVVAAGEPTGTAAGESIVVYKSPTCGCCTGWVEYLRDNGFSVETHDVTDMEAVRANYGVTNPRLKSCHTALVGGYVVEGHVPADDVRRLLSERPEVVGITAPGMPQMSPGMASIVPKGYDVLSFDAEGNVELFSRY